MNELVWPFEAGHYIGTPNDLGWCHYSGDVVATLRGLLGVAGDGDFGAADRAAVVAWHGANTGSALPIIRAQDWQALVDGQVVEVIVDVPKARAKASRRRTGST